ncbi:UNVERIFIED_CONTAM: hypothetical protein PYX00_002593 [Menopon gallinae]|uniref:Integrator complex subunit 12 n=1 Tax=Menopon gallinae TaxID=328185 RepID=A0AAW2IJF6_9NEOP
MASYEIDPVFSKALKLLHSNSKDSADQIMQLLEDIIEQKYGGTKSLNLKCGTLVSEDATKIFDSQKNARLSRGSSPVQAVAAVTQPSEKSSRDSTPLSEPVSSRTSPDVDDGDLALEIFEDDLNCTVCKGMSVGARNRLVECSDCHSLYHQECHKPPISENDINDPRVVWYCSDCTKKNQEKVQTKVKALHQESSHKKAKTENIPEKSSLFKRSEKSSSSNNSANSHSKNTGTGLGHLAAALQGSGKHISSSSAASSGTSGGTSSKSSASLNYSKNPGSPNPKPQASSVSAPANIIAADKRLQNMKKKAAAKMQEKRSKHK